MLQVTKKCCSKIINASGSLGAFVYLREMKLILIPLFILFGIHVHAQDASIRHYLKKTSSFELLYPCDQFNSEGLEIRVPDSIYNSGTITIKKLNANDVKFKNYSLNFSQDKVDQVSVIVKGKNKAKFESILNANFGGTYDPQKDNQEVDYKNCVIKITKLKVGGKINYIIQRLNQ